MMLFILYRFSTVYAIFEIPETICQIHKTSLTIKENIKKYFNNNFTMYQNKNLSKCSKVLH